MRLVRSPAASAPSITTRSFNTVDVVWHNELSELAKLSMKPFLPSTAIWLPKSPAEACATISDTSASIAFSAVSFFHSTDVPMRLPALSMTGVAVSWNFRAPRVAFET